MIHKNKTGKDYLLNNQATTIAAVKKSSEKHISHLVVGFAKPYDYVHKLEYIKSSNYVSNCYVMVLQGENINL